MDDITPECWLPVVGYEGIYDVSDLGRVAVRARLDARGWRRKAGFLKPWPRSKGHYLCITLCAEAIQAKRYIHELVLESFVGMRPSADQQVRHLDGCHTNNRLSNLAWGTPWENNQDRIRHGTSRRPPRSECSNGHELTPANTLLKKDGERRCRICHNAEQTERRRRKKEAA